MKPKLSLLILCGAFALLGAADASAAVRFAAPGGAAPASSECLRSDPCSLFNAASRGVPDTKLAPGDEIVVEPGFYSDTAGDLGPEGGILPQGATTIHGAVAQPRPVISLHGAGGTPGFFMDGGDETLGRLEIVSSGPRRPAFDLRGASNTVDGVIARSDGLFSCQAISGVIRDSACLSTGRSGAALEVSRTGVNGNAEVKLRNVTAIATGATSRGVEVTGSGTVGLTVDAVGVLSRGTAEDVFAEALSVDPHTPGTGATITVTLDHSDFADVGTTNDAGGGSATVSAPGSGENRISAPLLAADGYHQLPGSPTIDAGATDVFSGATDIDGNERAIGAQADIGADELGTATATSLSCGPASLVLGAGSATCTATVTSPAGGAPTGVVAFASDGSGSFEGDAGCTLVPTAASNESLCQLAYLPSAVGSGQHHLTVSYQGDAVHELSTGSATVGVTPPPPVLPPPPRRPPPAAANTSLSKTPARETKSRTATFVFTSNQAGSRFECRIDRASFKPCRSPFRTQGLKPGRHSFQVRAVGPGGTADPTPASFRWRVSGR